MFEWYGLIDIMKLLSVERPHVALHASGKVQLQFAFGVSLINVWPQTFYIIVNQYVPAVIAQANTRLVHPVILIFGDRGCSLAVVYWVVPGNRPFHFRDHIHAVI